MRWPGAWSPTGGGELGQWGRSGGGGGGGRGRSGGASGVVTRGLLVSGFICNFLDAGSLLFSFAISLVRFQCAF